MLDHGRRGERLGWPGPDLARTDQDAFAYGPLPPALFEEVVEAFRTAARACKLAVVRRTS